MKKIVFGIIMAIVIALTGTNVFATCEENDPGCTGSTTVGANLFNNGSWTFGNATNGGFANTAGTECATATGDKASAFTGAVDGLNTGSIDTNGISSAKAVLTFTGKATFNDVGNASITGAGEVKEGSFASNVDPSGASYFNAMQFAGAKLNSTTVSGTSSPVEFNKVLSAEGVAGGSIDNTNKNVTAFANNIANGISSANAANAIGGGYQTPNAMVEFTGTANIVCPTGGIVGTNGTGAGSITETALPNGFTLKASASVSENVTRTAN
ncbi:MAG: hypothetical protein Q7T50_05070 [Candidatus Magasanikbacteria bacterium]|nr:hypothetical protein [Candidatus Magasanikbacteria bacterium]